MADKTIGELPGIPYLDAGSLFVAEQQGGAVKVTGKQLTDFSNVETTAQVEQAKASAQEAKTAQAAAEAAILKGPIIQNGTWWVYNQTAGAYQDTGIKATGPQGIPGPTSSVNGISPDNSGNITLTAEAVGAYSKTENDTLLEKKSDADKVVNPNLLDNWYFGNPVNQRGQTSYTGAGYGIDRWRGVYGSEVVTLGNDNILLTLNNNQAIRQYIEFPSKFEGKTVTISILWEMVEGDYANVYGNTSAGMFAVMPKTEAFNKQISSATGTVQSGVSSLTVDIAGKGKIKVYAVKLELGSTQTLAHQDENGNWVLNEIPDYGEQLARCQRYYQLYTSAAGRPNDVYQCRPVMRDKSTDTNQNTTPTQGTIDIKRGSTTVTYYYNSCDL